MKTLKYVVTNTVPTRNRRILTPGKKYLVISEWGITGVCIKDNCNTELVVCTAGCALLDGAPWTVITEPPEPETLEPECLDTCPAQTAEYIKELEKWGYHNTTEYVKEIEAQWVETRSAAPVVTEPETRSAAPVLSDTARTLIELQCEAIRHHAGIATTEELITAAHEYVKALTPEITIS